MKEKKLAELERLTDSIVRGERVILFAPGLWAVITTIMLLLTSTVLLSGSLISIYGSHLEPSAKATYQLGGLIVLSLFVILPGLLFFRGYRVSRTISQVYSISLAIISIASIFQIERGNHLFPLSVSLVASILSIFLIRSPVYALCSEFYFLLKSKKKTPQ
jgi:hypothetical protein